MTTQINTTQENLMKEIISFGYGRGYDMKNLTPELLDTVMKHWLEVGKDFQKNFKELPMHVQRGILKV